MKATFTFIVFSVLFILCYSPEAHAQRKKLGQIEESELSMKSYDQDTSAAAVILFDFGESSFTFNHEINVVFKRHIRIKILKKSGYDWANFTIPYYEKGLDREKVTGIKAYTFNLEDGKQQKYKLESKDVFEEQRSENWFAKKFTMPNVQEGSVIDITYTIHSDFYYTLKDWEFQTTIPTLWSEYQVEIPEYFDYKFLMQGYLPINDANQSRVNGQNMVNNKYTWALKDVPALKPEKYITTINDYRSKIEFELALVKFPGKAPQTMTGNWEDVTKDLLMSDKFGTQLNRNGFFKEELAIALRGLEEPKQKMEAIYELVKKRVKWDEKYGVHTNQSIRKAFDSGSGSAAEINLLLTSMLLEAGLDAAPVLLSTRSNGQIRKAGGPMISKFNYVVSLVKIGEKEYTLDATDPMLPVGMLPVRCLNGEGRLINKADQRWVQLTASVPYTEFTLAQVEIKPNGDIVGQATESAGGYRAVSLRSTIQEDGEDKYIEKIAKEVGDYKIENPKFKSLDDIKQSLDLTYDIKVEGSSANNEIIYINPMMGHGDKETPFKLNERMYPVDFGTPIDETFMCTFTLPEGYVVDEAPKSVAYNLPDNGGRFSYILKHEGDKVQVMSKITFNKPVYYAPEYGALKQLYEYIVAKHAEQLVIKKADTASARN